MRTLRLFLIIFFMLAAISKAQVMTTEKTKTIDKVTGDSTFTESTIISHSEDITPRYNMIVVNPLKFFLFYNLTYFHNINDNIVIGGGIQMPTIKGIDGFGVNAELRFHPSGKMMKGFYIAPNLSFNSIKGGDIKTTPFSIGMLIGWQWFPGDQFAMGLGIGADYYWGNISDGDSDTGRYDGTVPALRFDIGYAW